MMDKVGVVQGYLSSLGKDPIDTQALGTVLADDARLMSTAGNSDGREAVVRRMTEPSGRVFRESSWSEPEVMGDAVKVTGRAPGSGSGSPILVFHFRDDKISLLQHQFFTARNPGSGTSIRLSQELKDIVNNSLAQRHPIVVAYVDEKGAPVLSFRGSVQAFSDTQLAFWARPESRLVEAVRKNPHVALIYRNEDTHEGFQFQGRGRIASDEEEARRVYASSPAIEQERDMAQLGVAVIVDLDSVEGGFVRLRRESEQVRMERNEG
jgi:general stress protein 26